jgi:4-methylaminobutanoate oxidase (formaldehyde-forming)
MGYVRAGSYGFSLAGAVGLVMVDAGEPIDQAFLDSGDWTIEIANKHYPALPSIKPLFDPEMKKIKC